MANLTDIRSSWSAGASEGGVTVYATKENLPTIIYWFLYILISFVFYQIMLVFFGWLFGQFKFFWNMEKKMLTRIGLKRFILDN